MKKTKIIIAGGGQAAWLSAALLGLIAGVEKLEVTIIEPEDSKPIGVGEGSWPNMGKLIEALKISPYELDSTTKMGIHYTNWYCKTNSPFNSWTHPFAPLPPMTLQGLPKDISISFENASHRISKRDEKYKSLWLSNQFRSGYQSNTALHYRADKFIEECKKKALQRNTHKRIKATIVECNISMNGIESIKLSNGMTLKADLYLDCTGFKRVLISALGSEIIDVSSSLPCNKAIVARTSRSDKSPIQWTTAKALSSGWIWTIPTNKEEGRGYIYSSDFISDKDAEDEFCKEIGKPLKEVRTISWKSGYLKEWWIKNCVAIGLSSGFSEPMEATAFPITLTQITQAIKIIRSLPLSSEEQEKAILQSNELLGEGMLGRVGYLSSHYILSKREDSKFWKHFKNDITLSKTSKQIIKQSYNLQDWSSGHGGFTKMSWQFLLTGMNFQPEEHFTMENQRSA